MTEEAKPLEAPPEQPLQLRQGIAKLVQSGQLTHEEPGSYYGPNVPDDMKPSLPVYDWKVLQAAFPNMAMIKVEDVKDERTGALLGYQCRMQDGINPDQLVDLRGSIPPTAELLVEILQAHYRGLVDVDAMREGADDAFKIDD